MMIQSIHDLLILLHAAAATISFFAGCFLIFSIGRLWNRQLFDLYWWALLAMVFLLAFSILANWSFFESIERLIFSGLFGLALYMLYRADLARRIRSNQPGVGKHDYIEHIGFTLISLFEGFIIVSMLNSGIAPWLVIPIALFGVLAGRWALAKAHRRAAVE
jgi:hypothetical protein